MRGILWLLVVMTLLAALTPAPAGARVPLPPTVPRGVTPDWTAAPGSPEVEYAPNLRVDLFRHRGLYYYWIAGHWRLGPTPTGPWKRVEQAPPALRRLDPALFKSIYKPKPPEP
jgi:hypothetical protein